MNDLNSLVRVTNKTARAAAVTLARAFQDYPESVYFMPDDETRRKRQPRIYHLVLKNSVVNGEVYATSTRMEGAAVWHLIDGTEPVWRQGFSIGWLWESLFMDRGNNKRRESYWEYVLQVRARVTPERYWYLMMMGVDPACQGQGHAGRLLRPMLERADREGTACFLETQLAKNVGLYEHFGFRVVEEGIIPGANMKSWAMARKQNG
jgi:GNAT superfamily N-acetyltransferase